MNKHGMSYSNFSTLLSCARKYQYKVVDGLEEAPNVNLMFGRALHAAINDVLTGKNAELFFPITWNSYEDMFEYERFNHQRLLETGLGFIAKFRRFYAPKLKPLIMERRLYSEYNGMKIEGTMDFLGEYDGELTLIDWKTTSRNYHEDKAHSSLQLYLYAYLCSTSLALRPKRIMYIAFNKALGSIQTPVSCELKEQDMYEALDNMLAYTAKLGDSYPKNYNSCYEWNRQCEFHGKCFPKENINENV